MFGVLVENSNSLLLAKALMYSLSNRYGRKAFAVTMKIHKGLFSPLSLTKVSGIFLPR